MSNCSENAVPSSTVVSTVTVIKGTEIKYKKSIAIYKKISKQYLGQYLGHK